jgi:hypothetical protein
LTSPAPTPTPKRWRKVVDSVLIAALLLPNAVAVIGPYESFPYSSAPMFAHYVGPGVPRYRFRMILESADGSPGRELPVSSLGLNHADYQRRFFGTVYGSTDPSSPFGHHPDDTPAALEERLGRHFERLAAVLAERDTAGGPPRGIRLEVARLGAGDRDAEIHVVGWYDAATHRFVHQWGRR